jgi:toxin CcdB
MAQFDVHKAETEGALVVNCQCELLDTLATRVVIPLYPPGQTPWSVPRLAPTVRFGEQSFILATPDMATVATRELGPPLGSIADQRYVILNAIDFLLTGA